jgi:hypothetical protein
MYRRSVFAAGLGGLVACLGAVGCGGSGTPVLNEASASYENLQIIGQAYYKASASLGRPPQKLDDLLPFLPKKGHEKNLRSPDDGQEYKILWGVDIRAAHPAGGQPPVLAYEQRGKNGKRYVLVGRRVTQIPDEDFKKANFPPGHQPPS